MKIFTWLAGFFEDQKGAGSSKRLALYVCLYFYWTLIKGSLGGKIIDQQILYTLALMILFLVGAVTSEFVAGAIKKTDNPPINPPGHPVKKTDE